MVRIVVRKHVGIVVRIVVSIMYAKLPLFFMYFFSYICCQINRHKKADDSIPSHADYAPLFFSTLQTIFHRIYNIKKSLTQAEITATSSMLTTHFTLISMSCISVANPRNKNIYIVFTVGTIYMLEMDRKWRRFYKKQSFKREVETFSFVHVDLSLNKQPFNPCLTWRFLLQIPENILNTQSFI